MKGVKNFIRRVDSIDKWRLTSAENQIQFTTTSTASQTHCDGDVAPSMGTTRVCGRATGHSICFLLENH